MKKAIAFMLMLALCLCGMAMAGEAQPRTYQLGDKMEDFTVTTYDGKSITLSEVLKEKELVLINIWATWCGYCVQEFPFMEQAYQQYKDKVEILALSSEPADTDEVLAEFVADMGMTFPVGRDELDFYGRFGVSGIPTSVVLDRFGTICYIQSGAVLDENGFPRMFDAFLGEGYTESALYHNLPAQKPNVQPSAEGDLAAALNVPDGELAFHNPVSPMDWPMTAEEKDGRSVLASTNRNVDGSQAVVSAAISAKAGDALAVTFKLSSESGCDLMQLRIDGETVKSFAGERDWMSYAYRFEADGEYDVSVAYVKDDTLGAGEDALWVDSIALLGGEQAAAALAANPVYPVGEEVSLTVMNPEAREILIDDVNGVLSHYFGDGRYYIIPGETADFLATLTAEEEPEIALGYCNYDGSVYVLTDYMTADGYAISGGIDSVETTGYSYAGMYLYLSGDAQTPAVTVTYFADEKNADAFVEGVFGKGVSSWTYADQAQHALKTDGLSDYRLTFADQDGNAVAGVMVQVCDEGTCMVYTSDENGVCEFSLAPYAYEIHILKAPEGYEADTGAVVTAPQAGGELAFTLEKK